MKWTQEDQAWADKQAEEHAQWARCQAEDKAFAAIWLQRMRRNHIQCTNCKNGIDGEPDGFGGAIGVTCQACDGTGWVCKPANVR